MPFARDPFRTAVTVAAVVANLGAAATRAEVLLEWTPHRDAIAERTLRAVQGPPGSLSEEPAFDAENHLVFDGRQTVTFPEADARKLPPRDFTVEARVRIDDLQQWGGVVGYTQDNGAYERGWLLGFDNDRFCFKLSNGGPLGGAIAAAAFAPGDWVSLLAVYDGTAAHLFVNGEHAGAGTVGGDVALPDRVTPFVLGAYQDDDEHYPITGRIALVRLSRGLPEGLALPAIDDATPAKTVPPPPFPPREPNPVKFAVHPRVSFPDPATAMVAWEAAPSEAVLFFGAGDTLDRKIECPSDNGRFAATLDHLSPATEYKYRLGTGPETTRLYTPIYSFDTRHNLSPARVTQPAGVSSELTAFCDRVVALAPDQGGYAVVLGLRDGQLAATLAARSGLHVIAADHDSEVVAAVRRSLYQSGVLGHRVSVLQLDDPSAPLPWTDNFADLVLSERGDPVAPPDECHRILRPSGGLLAIPAPAQSAPWTTETARDGWRPDNDLLIFRRDPLPGARDWTHQYGTAGNASYTGESLGGVSATSALTVQWIGRPGGDFGIDRQPRMPAPLAANGRLYHQGLDRLVALNAFNGAVLWSYEIPALRRLNIPHDCSNWSADDDHLYVAVRDRLWILTARTGELAHALALPAEDRQTHEWGYVANEAEILIGSSVRAGSAFHNFWGDKAWFDEVGTPYGTTQVVSDRLFAFRKHDAAPLWTYRGGLVINSTLSLHDGKLSFLESRSLTLPDDASAQVSDRRLWLEVVAVCLDAATGEILWERPAPAPAHVTAEKGFVQAAYGIATAHGFLAVLSEGHVDANGSYLGSGHFVCSLHDADGALKWETTSPWIEDHHGVHITHPVVTEERLYLAPHIHDIATGKPLGQTYGPRRGCSTIVATTNALLFRILGEGNSPLGLWSEESGSVSRFAQLRPSCWLNTVPAQGMLLVPEGGAGCSCGGWIETSVGFLPRSRASQPAAPE